MKKGWMLAAAIAAVCGTSVGQEETLQEAYEQIESLAEHGLETFEWALLLEAEGHYARIGDENESDLVLATVEFVMDARLNDWLSGHVGLLWEEDDTQEDNLDEGYITLGNAVYVQAGKFYLPFGNFESAFVSDPLTLELAEINRSSVLAGYGNEWISLAAGAFKGAFDETIEDLYAAVSVVVADRVQLGAYWLSDLMETDSLADLNDDLGQKESGAGAYANLYLGPFMVNAEFVSALNNYSIAGGSYVPLAYNLEASCVFADRWLIGAKAEGSNDCYGEYDGTTLSGKFPGSTCGAVVSCGFHEHAAVSLEYLRLCKLDDGDDGDLVTVQLAFEI